MLELLHKARGFLARNGLHIAVAALVIVAAGVLLRTHRYRSSERDNSAWAALGALPDPANFALSQDARADALRRDTVKKVTGLLQDADGTTAMPWLLLNLGGLHAAGREWNDALAAYSRVLEDFADSPAVDAAKPAIAIVHEEMGRYRDAAGEYEGLARDGGARFLIDAARSSELAGDASAAERLYRTALAEDLTEELSLVARGRLSEVEAGRLLSAPPEITPPEPAAVPSDLDTFIVPPDTAVQIATPAPPPVPQDAEGSSD